MRVVVAGGAGFVGSHLCDALLERGDDVICLDNLITGRRENIKHLIGARGFRMQLFDIIRDRDVAGDVDAIFNLASPASPPDYLKYPIETLDVGSEGTRNLLLLAWKKKSRFVMASTSEVYGDPLESPQKESYWGHVNPVGPRSVYDEAKRFAEAQVMAWKRDRNVDVRIARIFNTYGPRMRKNDGRVVSNFINQALRDEDITVYGCGVQTRSFCYVSDLVSGLLRLLDVDTVDGPVNLGNPEEITVRDLAEEVIALTLSKSKIVHRPIPVDDPQRRCPDITRARTLLGWQPQVSRADGLKKTADFFAKELLADRLK